MRNNSLLTKKILSWLVHYQYNIFEYNEGLCQNIVLSLEHVDLQPLLIWCENIHLIDKKKYLDSNIKMKFLCRGFSFLLVRVTEQQGKFEPPFMPFRRKRPYMQSAYVIERNTDSIESGTLPTKIVLTYDSSSIVFFLRNLRLHGILLRC